MLLNPLTAHSCPRCQGKRWLSTGLKGGPGGEYSERLVGCPECNAPQPIGQGRTFEGFEAVPGTDEMVTAAQAFAGGGGPHGLTIIGPNGCGKTHILEATAAVMREMGRSPRYVFVPDFLDRLRSTFDAASDWHYWDLWESWAEADVLLLDDLKDDGRPTVWAVGQVERIVDARYRKARPYVVTTNGTLDSIARTWGRRLADRLFDHNSGTVRVVYCSAPSYRTRRAWT